MDSLGNPPQDISDAYISYVLSKRLDQLGDRFERQFEQMEKVYEDFSGQRSVSSYKLAILGLYFVNRGDNEKANKILEELVSRQNQSDGAINSDETSITRSSGKQLRIETTALCMILLLELDSNNYA